MKKESRKNAFTLLELLIASTIFTVLAAFTYQSLFHLQRSSAFVAGWSDMKVNQVRLLDALETDLRNAKAITVSTGGIFVTMTGSPQLYTEYETAGARAGDPSPTSAQAPLTFGTSGAGLTASNSVTVRYSRNISDGVQTISRSVTWTEGGASKSATREIATFAEGTEIVLVVGSTTATVSIRSNQQSWFANAQQPVSSWMTNTIFLRAKKFNT